MLYRCKNCDQLLQRFDSLLSNRQLATIKIQRNSKITEEQTNRAQAYLTVCHSDERRFSSSNFSQEKLTGHIKMSLLVLHMSMKRVSKLECHSSENLMSHPNVQRMKLSCKKPRYVELTGSFSMIVVTLDYWLLLMKITAFFFFFC